MSQTLQQQSIGIVFNALALASYGPSLVRVQQYPQGAQVLDLISIDGTLQETITREIEVTDHPVEVTDDDVSFVSDHARKKPIEVQLDGVVSDTMPTQSAVVAALQGLPPAFGFNIGTGGTAAVGLAFAGSPAALLNAILTRSQAAYEQLVELYDDHELVTLATPRETFDSMMMTSLAIPRDQHTGAALRFSARFKQVVTVQSKVTLLPAVTQPVVDLGNQPTKQSPAGVQKTSSTLLQTLKAAGVPLPDKPPAGWTGPRFFK